MRPDEQIVAVGNINDLKEEEKVRCEHNLFIRQDSSHPPFGNTAKDGKSDLETSNQLLKEIF